MNLRTLPVTVRRVGVDRSGKWLAAGWHDMWKAPGVSFAYGGAFVLASYALTFGLIDLGYGSLVLPLAGGFLMLSPIFVVGLYEVSRRLESGQSVGLGEVCVFCMKNAGQVAAMGVVLLLFHFFWVVIAIFLFALFFSAAPPTLESFFQEVVFTISGAGFLLLGTLLGAFLAVGIFAITAVSIPMLLDRDVDVVTAIMTSLVAVRENWQVMVGWAALIGLVTAVGLASFYVGLIFALPTLGYATWHAYRDLIGAKPAA
ncbi:MAG: DUF2189 domain-containing protein [Hyphomicrobiales bacterium]|nr:DUF2189 domain-containing protein [Hyphomicrobiales bacterium]